MSVSTVESQVVPLRPRISRRFRVEDLGSEGVVLLCERGHVWLEGDLFPRLLPLLDGRRTPKELVQRLHGAASPAEAFTALVLLARMRLLEEETAAAAPPVPAAKVLRGADAARPGAGAPAPITALSLVDGLREKLVLLLRERELEVAPNAGGLAIVLADDYLSPELADLGRLFQSRGQPWLLVKPRGDVPWVGPLFTPKTSPCWECLAACLRRNRAVELHLAWRAGGSRLPAAPLAASDASLRLALGLAVDRALAHLTGGDAGLQGQLLTLDLTSGAITEHRVTGPPDCCLCDGKRRRRPDRAAVVLEPRPYRATRDGGYRTATTEETLARLAPAISWITGIVHSLRRQTVAGDGLVHVYTAAHATPRRYRSWETLHRRLKSRSGGKGIGETQAQVSALAEAVERYAGFFRGDEPRQRATLRQLGERALHPNACMLFSEGQYRERKSWNAGESHANWVPEPFDEDSPVDWTPLWSLTRQRSRLLPTAYCFFDYQDAESARFCRADSNGNAAGNSLEEAILQGFLELLERDATALWWYSRAPRPAIRIDTFGRRYFDRLAALFTSLGRELWVLDLTSDFGVPVAAAVSRTLSRRPDDLLIGFGAHLDPEIAVGRALSELCQFLPREGDEESEMSARKLHLAARGTLPWLEPAAGAAPRTAASWRRRPSGDLAEDVRTCVRLARERGLEVLVLDQTRWDTPLPVVKVVVPGLRPWWARFAPGRLYQVPRDLGWITEPLSEDRLNPAHLFL